MHLTTKHHLLVVAVLAIAAPALAQEGDPASGEKIFRKCAACHTLSPDGKNRVGPDLYGVIGRTTGTAEGFKYSDAMKALGEEGHVWTVEELNRYLENPKEAIPGNKMAFVGLKDAQDRADVIAYIEQESGG